MAHLYASRDADTVRLILQLQREDIEALMNATKDKHDTTDKTDDDFALQLQLQELSLIETFYSDRAIAQSHALAMVADRKILVEEIAAEQQAVRDRELAAQLARNDNMLVPFVGHAEPACESEEQMLARQEARICATIFDNDDSNKQLVLYTGGKLADDGSDSHRHKEPFIACVACNEDLPWFDILEAPCHHYYCADCLTSLFESSMTDESLYPPRCCRQPIPLDDAKLVLHPRLVRNFREKSIELDTKDRTYCFDPRCSTFIPLDNVIDNVGRCPGCGKRTCAICKVAAHLGDCPRDETLQEFLRAADDQGWQRCYSCHRVVDLRSGCNHITCPCGAHFCYVCGASWTPRTCECPQWDEARLHERAVQIVNRDPRQDSIVLLKVLWTPALQPPQRCPSKLLSFPKTTTNQPLISLSPFSLLPLQSPNLNPSLVLTTMRFTPLTSMCCGTSGLISSGTMNAGMTIGGGSGVPIAAKNATFSFRNTSSNAASAASALATAAVVTDCEHTFVSLEHQVS